eukprot:scaffold227880_cov114-Attheya_sp.AAC.1
MAIWRRYMVKICMCEKDVTVIETFLPFHQARKTALSSRVHNIHNDVIQLTFLLRRCFDEVRDRVPLQHGMETELPTRKALNNANEIFMMKV